MRIWSLQAVFCRWLVCALLGCTLGAPAVELRQGPEVTPDTTRAVIQWETDVPAGARVQFGLEAGRWLGTAKGPVGTRHSVRLEGLRPATAYVFTVGTARVVLATNTFQTSGTPLAPPAPTASLGDGGSTAPPGALSQAPPARETWGNLRTLQDHFERHGPDVQATSAEDYAAKAWLLLQRARQQGLPAKRDRDGVLRVFDPTSRLFGAYNRDGTTRTLFKPGRRGYFDDQPGRPVDLRKEP